MTEQIKPKQCGKTAWYIPNQKGFVPEMDGEYYYCRENIDYAGLGRLRFTSDYAMIEAGNCFETEQEALDAFVKPADTTPLTWDELCEIHNSKDNRVFCLNRFYGDRNFCINVISTDEIFGFGEILFNSDRKYWLSKESLEVWIEQQKGE